MKIKALSIRQPFAEWIIKGNKSLELRTWAVKYRGPLLICAGVKKDPEYPDLPYGVAVGIVDLVDIIPVGRKSINLAKDSKRACCPLTRSEDTLGWVLKKPRRIKPFKVKGQLGLFEVVIRTKAKATPKAKVTRKKRLAI